jgi:hypothetical protein
MLKLAAKKTSVPAARKTLLVMCSCYLLGLIFSVCANAARSCLLHTLEVLSFVYYVQVGANLPKKAVAHQPISSLLGAYLDAIRNSMQKL